MNMDSQTGGADIETLVEDRSLSPVDSGDEQQAEVDDNMSNPVPRQTTNGIAKPSANSKDPNRPRRKKARRACYACQRAHLTCGDERPCQRCVKRGLAEQCQDGVRKKAKYLHDAPTEALLPGVANQYNQNESLKRSSTSSTILDSNGRLQSFSATQPVSQAQIPLFGSNLNQMPPPMIHERTSSFGAQSIAASAFGLSQPLQSPTMVGQAQGSVSLPSSAWNDTLFGAEDPSLFNFDLASMNFGNHYGALEFGMLGNMAKGAGDVAEDQSQRGSINFTTLPYGSMSDQPPLNYDGMMDWSNGASLNFHFPGRKEPNAFAIETTAHLTSPENINTTPETLQNDSPLLSMQMSLQSSRQSLNSMQLAQSNFITQPVSTPHTQDKSSQASAPPVSGAIASQIQPGQYSVQQTQITTPQIKAKSQLPNPPNSKRPRDPSTIYTSITQPYPYTSGFHNLIDYLKRRFAARPDLTLRIAKSLASIRPSFIATTKTLNRDDLVFMEKCFQRTLFEYEAFIEGVGTPTIIARRTGEIVGVGKEFCILTGWRRSVLLGREPNLNVNKGRIPGEQTPAHSKSGVATGTGTNTPSIRKAEDETADKEPRQQPVFLSELLDDDSVVQFYEDFSRLAFGDSRGSVMGVCKLLKYRTQEDEIRAELNHEADKQQSQNSEYLSPNQPRASPSTIRHMQRSDSFAQARPADAKKGISGQKGISKLGMTEGKVDCAFCWTVKRDVFDIPMLIVMNFLPCI